MASMASSRATASTTRSAICSKPAVGPFCNPEIIMFGCSRSGTSLAALVVWLGGMVTAVFGDLLRPFHLVSLACGSIILVSLFIMKFVGPPPHAFVPRAALTALIAARPQPVRRAARRLGSPPRRSTSCSGLVLLFWVTCE